MTDLSKLAGGPAKGPRLATLDALRGMAILGILAVNASFFATTVDQAIEPRNWWAQPQTEASLTVFTVMQVFFEAKMISMFSMLFGVSIYLVGGERGDPVRSPPLKRRLGWLLLFGALHGLLIWYGDILFSYALAGFLVMLVRSLDWKKLLLIGLAIWASTVFWSLAAGAAMAFMPSEAAASMTIPAADYRAGYGGGFVDSLSANMRDWVPWGLAIEIGNVLFSGPLMLIGLALYKCGVFRGEASTRVYLGLVVAGLLALGVIAAFTIADVRDGFQGPLHGFSDGLTSTTALPITLMYGSLLILGLKAGGAAAAIPNLLRPVGRMAFTNYLTQSLIMTGLFYGGRGPGWFQEVDRPGLALIVVSIWVLQIIWSHLWLARFEIGPFEWVWRSLIAKRRLPLSRDATSAGAA